MFAKKKWSLFCIVLLFVTVFIQISNSSIQKDSFTKFLRIDEIRNNDFIDTNDLYLSDLVDPLFRLRAMTNDNPERMNFLFEIQEQLKEIGIAVDVEVVDWPTFVEQLIAFREFDMAFVGLTGSPNDPDYFSGVYEENGSLNFFGYNTTMDWDEGLGTGINEWYIQQGKLIMPPDSNERVQHYWDWEQYLMDEILPMIPGLTPYGYDASWSNLNGYNMTDGLLQSWGKMSWTGLHTGQYSTSVITIEDNFWSDLNPLFQGDLASKFISDACMDPIIKLDSDKVYYPHIADYIFLNDTYIRLTIRDGIQWQTPPTGSWDTEYVTAADVFFTLYSWKTVSDQYDWLEDMVIVDDMTLDIYVDGDPYTTENEPYASALGNFWTNILPEHYLNQTQLPDGITPDITHPSWNTFSTHCFGTGLFEIENYAVGYATNLTVWNDCWWLDESITSDPNLDWENRFGDFSGGLTELKIWNLSDPLESLSYFEYGYIDILDVTDYPTERAIYEVDTDFSVYSKLRDYLGIFGFNMREERGIPLQSRDPCPFDPSMTIGLAVRKAIAYAIDWDEISNVLYNGEAEANHYPIFQTLGVWLNPNIIKYEHNLTRAKELMMYAGFETGLDSDGDGLTDLEEIGTTLTDRFNPDTDGDILTDGEEVLIYATDPNDSDTEGDGMPDGWEVFNGLDPLIDDSEEDPDSDGLTNEEEHSAGTDPHNPDSDGDGLLDGDEVKKYYTDPLVPDATLDSDSDGLTNVEEVDTYHTDPLDDDSDDDTILDGEEVVTGTDGYETDPNDADTDGDLMPDGWEVNNGLNPLINDASLDPDSDGLTNREEYQEGTDPHDADTDNDELTDGDEVDKYFTDPLVSDADLDSDSDGLTNVAEVDTYLTDPLDADTDDDYLNDGDEINVYCTDPCDCDSDDDTITDCEEVVYGADGYITDPTAADTDGDGIDDAEEIANGTDPTNPNDPPTSSPTPTPTNTTTTETGSFIGGFISLGFVIVTAFAIIITVERRNKYYRR